jgi:hypothetical protein
MGILDAGVLAASTRFGRCTMVACSSVHLDYYVTKFPYVHCRPNVTKSAISRIRITMVHDFTLFAYWKWLMAHDRELLLT